MSKVSRLMRLRSEQAVGARPRLRSGAAAACTGCGTYIQAGTVTAAARISRLVIVITMVSRSRRTRSGDASLPPQAIALHFVDDAGRRAIRLRQLRQLRFRPGPRASGRRAAHLVDQRGRDRGGAVSPRAPHERQDAGDLLV